MKKAALLFAILIVSSMSYGQKYLSKEAQEVQIKWNNTSFSSIKTLKENLASVPEFSIYNSLLENSQIQTKMDEQEMVTLFVIMDSGFSDLKKKQKDSLFNNKKGVEQMITFLAIPGRVDRNGMEVAAKKNHGKARFATVQGTELKVLLEGDKLYLQDAKGKKAAVVATNFYHKNGIFHIIDKRLSPNK